MDGAAPKATWVKAGEGVYSAVDWYTGGALTNYINSNDQPWSAEHLLNAANLAINFIPISAAEAKALQIGKAAEKAGVSLIQKAGQWIKVVFKGEARVVQINNPVLESVRTGSALKLDAQHAFNDIIDNYATWAQEFDLVGNDKVVRQLYQVKGSLNGKEGIFEWIIDPDPLKGVTHRRFIEGVEITGKPNAFPKR
ncbi:hypothetical protein MKX42_06105 [Paenibacillus sp. FSL R7-0204]|uniref:hypothetical protein n=1 Tax=Paenibacillus sp. FSL R7-0204 TaxID=2921675 RepID=UPI0030F4E689